MMMMAGFIADRLFTHEVASASITQQAAYFDFVVVIDPCR